ncbi:MAG: alanine dehydrogenase [Mycoplasma sp.]|nr:alanine dehydrogenase [Mycoplasma sp.]
MTIGIPKEIKAQETRVGLVPSGVIELIKHGHKVYVEKDAGLLSGFSDEDYQKAGAEIVSETKSVWDKEIIIKVKEPQSSEYQYFYEGQIIFTYFHLANDKELTQALIDKKVTSIAYEMVQLEDRSLPLLRPMSEVAGKLAVINALFFAQITKGGAGMLLSGTPGTKKGQITIIGGGIAGTSAASMAIGIGANVTLIESNENRIRELNNVFGDRITILKSNHSNIEQAVIQSDVVISTVLIPGAAAPKLITKEMVQKMKKNSIIIDVAIDQGGSTETSTKATTHNDPIYKVYDVLHYTVANIPAAAPQTSTIALTNATFDYVLRICNASNINDLLNDKKYLPIRKAVQTIDGALVNKDVSLTHNIKYTEISEVI